MPLGKVTLQLLNSCSNMEQMHLPLPARINQLLCTMPLEQVFSFLL
jgi:hypothetical protein